MTYEINVNSFVRSKYPKAIVFLYLNLYEFYTLHDLYLSTVEFEILYIPSQIF